MSPQETLRQCQAHLEQTTDNLLSDLQCPPDRFLFLVGNYLKASQLYAEALVGAKGTVSDEVAEAYAEEARFFQDQTMLIGILHGYRKRLGFG